MQVYVQKSTRTTFPRNPSAVSGGELSQPVAPSKPGTWPSTGSEPALRRLLKRLMSRRSSQRPERAAYLGREEVGLLPGREVVASVDFVVVDEIRVGLLGPAPRRLIELSREDADRSRH